MNKYLLFQMKQGKLNHSYWEFQRRVCKNKTHMLLQSDQNL